jgi:phosphohistidine phosphatase
LGQLKRVFYCLLGYNKNMEIYILRHGVAVERGTGGFSETKRPLTKEGRVKMVENAKGMVRLGIKCGLILSSPYVRAHQTAAIAAKALQIPDVQLTRSLIPSAPFQDIVSAIKNKYPRAESIMLVGHEPHLSGLIAYLIAGNSFPIDLKKGGLCLVETGELKGPACSTLKWILTPAQLRTIA